jgi:hypothetical protein
MSGQKVENMTKETALNAIFASMAYNARRTDKKDKRISSQRLNEALA